MAHSRRTACLLAAAILSAAASCGKTAVVDRPANAVVTMADPRFMGLLPIYVADRFGHFAAEGVTVKWLDVREPAQIERLYATGQSDLIMTTYPALVPRELLQKSRSRFLMAAFEDNGSGGSAVLVPPQSKLKGVEDLAGRKVGTYSGASQRLYADLVLRGFALETPAEVVQVSTAAQVPGLLAGAYDALFTVEPYVSIARNAGAHVLAGDLRSRYLGDPFAVGAAVASSRLSADLVLRLRRALASALKDIEKEPRKARTVLAEVVGVSMPVAERMALYRWVTDCSDRDIESIDRLMKALAQAGLLSRTIPAREFVGTPKT